MTYSPEMGSLLENKTVLVTGAAGFIGHHLTDELASRTHVRAFDHFDSHSPEELPDDVEIVEAEVQDPKAITRAVEGVDIIFHQAALRGTNAVAEAPRRGNQVNIGGTLEVLEAARHADCRVVIASSAAIYGEAEALPIAEESAKTPTSLYGAQKLAGDQYARLYHEQYGLETVILRYFNVFGTTVNGGRHRGVVGAFLDQARDDGEISVHGDGTQTRDLVHVDDIVQANLLAAMTDQVGRAYNIGSSDETKIGRLARRIASRFDTDVAVSNDEEETDGVRRSVADTARAQASLGYEPERTVKTFVDQALSVEVSPTGRFSRIVVQ